MDMLAITNLQKRFGDKSVLKGLDLSVPEHSVFGFIGKNGAGKTTTMKTILGLLQIILRAAAEYLYQEKRLFMDRRQQTDTLVIYPMYRNSIHL